jgi:hypothetical protein
MRDVMDRLEALYIRLIEVEANLYAATEALRRIPFGRGRVARREFDRLDHFVHTGHETIDAILDEFRTALRAAMKQRSGQSDCPARSDR